MSTDMHKRGHHGEGEYEHQDLSAAAIFGFLIALVVLGILIQFVISGTLHLFEKYNAGHQPRARVAHRGRARIAHEGHGLPVL